MKRALFILFLLLISGIFADCEKGQIDINNADAKELDKLAGIGEVKAQAIIDARPFNSIGDLINVYGIGEATLKKIKEQGLVCVDNDENKEETEEVVEKFEETTKIETKVEEDYEINIAETIKLNTQNIKSVDESEKSNKNKAGFWLGGFCVLLLFLFLIKKRKYKNEFD